MKCCVILIPVQKISDRIGPYQKIPFLKGTELAKLNLELW